MISSNSHHPHQKPVYFEVEEIKNPKNKVSYVESIRISPPHSKKKLISKSKKKNEEHLQMLKDVMINSES